MPVDYKAFSLTFLYDVVPTYLLIWFKVARSQLSLSTLDFSFYRVFNDVPMSNKGAHHISFRCSIIDNITKQLLVIIFIVV